MTVLEEILTSPDATIRNCALESYATHASAPMLLEEAAALEVLRHQHDSLYVRVRALFFLYAIHRFHLPAKAGVPQRALIPGAGVEHLLDRRFEEAIRVFLQEPTSAPVSSALGMAYQRQAFQTLADQVRRSVKSVRGNQWMFRCGHPLDYPLRLRPELLERMDGGFPILHESTPVRMDLTHSGWSDIFFLGMDYPEGARVLNISVDLAVNGEARPPVEAFLRVIDEPVLRLTSIDLGATSDVTTLREVFDFGEDYLGLLKASVIAGGLVPPGLEGADQPLELLLERLTGRAGYGLEIASQVNDIPKGSRLAVSTNLLASLIAVAMRATGQTRTLTGTLAEDDRRLVAARAILGEWLGGSGGGWQDSGGVWPGMKLIEGQVAVEGDLEYGISRGCLLPRHHLLDFSSDVQRKLEESLVLVHGGMAQDVGPVLEMVTEKYLLRSEREWKARQDAIGVLAEVLVALRAGDIPALGAATERNFFGPLQEIIPWATNAYTERVIARTRAEFGADFWGFWMLGGMAGGGMGFMFAPSAKSRALVRLAEILREAKRELEAAVPFAMEPVVYQFAINQHGTRCELLRGEDALMPPGYYSLLAPSLLRLDPRNLSPLRRSELERLSEAARGEGRFAAMPRVLFETLMPRGVAKSDAGEGLAELLERYGFDREQHELIRQETKQGRVGLAQNRLPVSARLTDVDPEEIADAARDVTGTHLTLGTAALREGAVAVVTLAGGLGTRWTKGAGVVKALNPFAKIAGRHRDFVEVHLSKSRRVNQEFGVLLPHVFTTSYLTHPGMARAGHEYEGPLLLSEGRSIGLRMVPTERDLRFAWEESRQQQLDERQQKMRASVRAALIGWAKSLGEGADYTDNLPLQCLHPVGHWYEIANLLLNGTLSKLLEERPHLQYLLVHNIDTLGASVDPALLGWHIASGAALTTEVIPRFIEDRGGGLAKVDGRPRLVEGLALPQEELEFKLSFYNSLTTWVSVPALLAAFGLAVSELGDPERVRAAVRRLAVRMPTYLTLKDVKKRWGKGQEDIYPVAQWEKLWGDMTALAELDSRFIAVPRPRGQQLKEPAQLDGWLRDGSAAYVESLGVWGR
jgi:galactokinase/mevalonate kinase-like predicted kinase